MFYVAMKILHNEHNAEDAVHQAFLSILENLDKISNVECPKTQSYIVIIVERKAIDTIMVILQKNLLKFLI
jgi:RNA polymerase sigma-70 factor (ECF subfamily)